MKFEHFYRGRPSLAAVASSYVIDGWAKIRK